MINMNFDQLLDTMTRAQILRELETNLDTAIARKIEKEARKNAVIAAKRRVADNTYTTEDLSVLQDDLERRGIRGCEMSPIQTPIQVPVAPVDKHFNPTFKVDPVVNKENEPMRIDYPSRIGKIQSNLTASQIKAADERLNSAIKPKEIKEDEFQDILRSLFG